MGELPSRTVVAGALAVLAVAGGVGLGMMRRPTPSPPSGAAPPSSTSPAALLKVHVAGWVMSPGVVSLPEHAIVADAIEAAGGLRSGASVESINLASRLRDGDQVVVPGPGVTATPTAGDQGGDGLVSLNRATAAELEALPGVGPVLAERIVAHREQAGGFDTVEDLLEVPGIGEAKLATIRDLVRP